MAFGVFDSACQLKSTTLPPKSLIVTAGTSSLKKASTWAVVGPASDQFGQGGISWITGTATWMYIAATQHILGIQPTLDGLAISPHLPAAMNSVRVRRRFRGCMYDIQIDNAGRDQVHLEVNGTDCDSTVVPAQDAAECTVRCTC